MLAAQKRQRDLKTQPSKQIKTLGSCGLKCYYIIEQTSENVLRVFGETVEKFEYEKPEEIHEIIKTLKKSAYTVIYTTNSIDEILLSDRVIIIDNNKIAEEFKKTDILENIDILKKYDIKVPEIVQALKKLRNSGVNISLEDWTFNDLTDKIIGELKK